MLSSTEDGNVTFQWALDFISELAANGLEHAVISPGSRSTPLTLAAASDPRIQKHVVLDERSAGFLALGIGKSTGKPAALICTSGTAAANYYPAIVEAKMSATPLLILTADRPPQLRSIGASQAIDQIKMYGDYPVMFFEVGEPQKSQDDIDRLRLLACQAFIQSRKQQGPVHLNFAFRKPLEPSPEYLNSAVETLKKNIEQQLSPKIVANEKKATLFRFPEEVSRIISKSRRPVIIAGPSSISHFYEAAARMSNTWGIPLIAESPSQLFPFIKQEHLIIGQDSFLRNQDIREELKPDLILRFGDQPIGKGIELYLKHHKEIYHILFSNNADWQDATFSVNYKIDENPVEINTDNISIETDENWITKWREYRNNFITLRNRTLIDGDSLTDGMVFHTIGQTITESENIFLSNSFPARDIDLFGAPINGNHAFFVNRGASGIDGVLSTAIGATIASNKPGILFIGDLAFLHDTNALLSNKFIYGKQTLIVVLINNQGGNIFRMLPVHEHKDHFETYFQTTQNVSIKNLAQAYNIGYRRVQYHSNLAASFKELTKQTGIQILECITDADQSMIQRRSLWDFQ